MFDNEESVLEKPFTNPRWASKPRCPLSDTFPRSMFQLDSKTQLRHRRNASQDRGLCLSKSILLVIWFLWIHSSHSSLAKGQPLPDQAVLSRCGCGIAMCRLRARREGTCRGHVCNFSWVEYALVRGPYFAQMLIFPVD